MDADGRGWTRMVCGGYAATLEIMWKGNGSRGRRRQPTLVLICVHRRPSAVKNLDRPTVLMSARERRGDAAARQPSPDKVNRRWTRMDADGLRRLCCHFGDNVERERQSGPSPPADFASYLRPSASICG